MNYRTKQFVNHNDVCDIIFFKCISNENDKITVDIPYKIVRDTRDKVVKTKSETKDYRIVYTKRRIVNSFYTLPYGFYIGFISISV